MKSFLTRIFTKKREDKSIGNDFSDFFVRTKSSEKSKVIQEVLREANEEQREMVKGYKNRLSTA